ncbi:hypothetical protein PBY51_001164 [Eleginops maclovinus]|uniref:Syntaphilin n=1 Tax=Eleginops maclovinus TaxID=56733 RepID=A0AAN7XNX9_ELEMC|nr:hypothetical protein PBY51_001164 [Eleginops maclovinus]
MSLTPGRKSSSGQRRRSVGTAGVNGRYSLSETPSTHTHPAKLRLEVSPAARTHPSTPRRQVKLTCSDNHGIRPPPPEQYLTPLQQKEVCIRHLRARLRDNVERLQHRDSEISGLRAQLLRMQEDWIQEEVQRLEAQLELQEARREIRLLQDEVRASPQEPPHQHQLHPGARPVGRPGGRSRSCGCSPAGTLSRGATLQPEGHRGPRQTHLLLEAALLSEPRGHSTQGPPTSSPYKRLCSGGAVLPVSHSCSCIAHTPHTHLYLHLPQEEAPGPASDPLPMPPPPERKVEVRSQGCSPTISWLWEEAPPPSETHIESPLPGGAPPHNADPPDKQEEAPGPAASDPIPTPPPLERKVEVRSQGCSPTISWLCDEAPPLSETHPSPLPGGAPPHIAEPPDKQKEVKGPLTCQPPPTAPLPERQDAVEVEIEGEEEGVAPPQCHWSRYFLVDLLALAMPVVPTVAWMWGPRGVLPGYHIGSLLRGCCAVALTSLRRRGAGRGGRPPNTNGTTQI